MLAWHGCCMRPAQQAEAFPHAVIICCHALTATSQHPAQQHLRGQGRFSARKVQCKKGSVQGGFIALRDAWSTCQQCQTVAAAQRKFAGREGHAASDRRGECRNRPPPQQHFPQAVRRRAWTIQTAPVAHADWLQLAISHRCRLLMPATGHEYREAPQGIARMLHRPAAIATLGAAAL